MQQKSTIASQVYGHFCVSIVFAQDFQQPPEAVSQKDSNHKGPASAFDFDGSDSDEAPKVRRRIAKVVRNDNSSTPAAEPVRALLGMNAVVIRFCSNVERHLRLARKSLPLG